MEDKILQELLLLESPWKWNRDCAPPTDEYFVTRQTEKCDNISEENEFQWTTFTLHLLLAYEYLDTVKDSEKALDHIKRCEEHLCMLKNTGCEEPLFVSNQRALWHVTFAAKGVIMHSLKQPEDKVKKMIMNAEALKPTSDRDIAGILGIKAGVYVQYGNRGHQLALEFARKAASLDPDQAEWHFLLGNCLGRIRRRENYHTAGEEEIAEIEKANLLENNASYIVHLAQLYSEQANSLFYNGNADASKTYSFKAVQRFKEALALRPNCSSLIARVAHGLLRVGNKKAVNAPYVKSLLDKVVEMAPNNILVYHDLGYYYEKFENNTEQAIFYLNKAHQQNNIQAFKHLTLLKWKQGVELEIIMQDIKEALKVYLDEDNQADILSRLGACYLMTGKMEEALKYFNEALSLNPKFLQNYLGFSHIPTNLVELVRNEITNQSIPSNNAVVFLKKSKNLISQDTSECESTMTLDCWVGLQMKTAGKLRKPFNPSVLNENSFNFSYLKL